VNKNLIKSSALYIEKSWFTESKIPKSYNSLNFKPAEIWLYETMTWKTCDWLNAQLFKPNSTKWRARNHLIGWTTSTLKTDWKKWANRNDQIGLTPISRKSDWTRATDRKQMISWNFSSKTPDWMRGEGRKHPISRNFSCKKTWLEKSWRSKTTDWVKSLHAIFKDVSLAFDSDVYT
jgi:hypothetical protein